MGIIKKAVELANLIKKQDSIIIIAHGDADGVSGAAIASIALNKIGLQHKIKFIKYLNEDVIKEYSNNFIFFIDVGNGNINEIIKNKINCVIADHHFTEDKFKNSLNPFYYGIDGSNEISASGLSYLISSNIAPVNASIAIIGAIGDLQDLRQKKLIGLNREILKKSDIATIKDFRLYGRDMPLYKMLSFSSFLPIFFKNVKGAISFLRENGFNESISWIDLNYNDKRKLFSIITRAMIEKGYGYEEISNLYGEVYEMNGIDVREISSVINSVAKYGYYDIAMDICINGDLSKAREPIKKHRKNIKNGIKFAKNRINEHGIINYFHGGNFIKDTILGTITGMLLKNEGISNPVIGFAENENGIKVSARAPYELIEKGLNLSKAMNKTANKLGGYGGGHKAAAGAIIPKGYEDSFLQMFEQEISNQLTL